MSALSKWSWTLSQRRALIVIIGVACIALAVRAVEMPAFVGAVQSNSSEAAASIDPNTATAAELASIPGIGEKKAASLVSYRDRFVTGHSGRLAFAQPEDLMIVSGIGPATVEKMRPYLTFDSHSHVEDTHR